MWSGVTVKDGGPKDRKTEAKTHKGRDRDNYREDCRGSKTVPNRSLPHEAEADASTVNTRIAREFSCSCCLRFLLLSFSLCG